MSKRRRYGAQFKARVVLEALKGERSIMITAMPLLSRSASRARSTFRQWVRAWT